MNNDIELLKSYPSVSQVEQVLDKYEYPPLPLISALLNYSVPQIYVSLPKTAEAKLRCMFQTLIGLGNLLAKVSTLLKVSSNDHELKLYYNFLQSLADEQLFTNITKIENLLS